MKTKRLDDGYVVTTKYRYFHVARLGNRWVLTQLFAVDAIMQVSSARQADHGSFGTLRAAKEFIDNNWGAE